MEVKLVLEMFLDWVIIKAVIYCKLTHNMFSNIIFFSEQQN